MNQPEYSIVRSKRRITGISISVNAKGVVVRAPFWVPVWVIKNFVAEKKDWIESQQKKIPSTKKPEIQYRDGEGIYYLGEKLPLKIIETDISLRTQISLEEQFLSVTVSSHHTGVQRTEEIKKSLSRWYVEMGVGLITEKVNRTSQTLGVSYARITLKNVSSIWGSCSGKNNLNFNRHLIMAPHPIIDYVVIHEVCHLVHRDHSSRFWALVRRLDPDYKTHRRWLRENRDLLIF